MSKTGIVILAAGNSSRLGRPKQLLPYQGKTLLAHVVAEAQAASFQPIVVVTGAHHTAIHPSLEGQPVSIAFNPSWETGMASGIVAGVEKALSLQPHLQAVIIAVCDQPHITAGLFQTLLRKYNDSHKGLIACTYSKITGTPVLFDHHYFTALLTLTGDAGARQVLKRYPDDLATIPFPQGNIDIDTEEDYSHLSA